MVTQALWCYLACIGKGSGNGSRHRTSLAYVCGSGCINVTTARGPRGLFETTKNANHSIQIPYAFPIIVLPSHNDENTNGEQR